MNIIMLSGSPKAKNSASAAILNGVGMYIGERAQWEIISAHRQCLDDESEKKLGDCDAVVIAFPVYVDGVPSHLLAVMEQLERSGVLSGKRIYAAANCGFYEGTQCRPSMSIMEKWCIRVGAQWCGGIGFGGGGGLAMMEAVPMGFGLKRSLGKALSAMADSIIDGAAYGEHYTSLNCPEFLYRISAQISWTQLAKANGLKKRDLARRP